MNNIMGIYKSMILFYIVQIVRYDEAYNIGRLNIFSYSIWYTLVINDDNI